MARVDELLKALESPDTPEDEREALEEEAKLLLSDKTELAKAMQGDDSDEDEEDAESEDEGSGGEDAEDGEGEDGEGEGEEGGKKAKLKKAADPEDADPLLVDPEDLFKALAAGEEGEDIFEISPALEVIADCFDRMAKSVEALHKDFEKRFAGLEKALVGKVEAEDEPTKQDANAEAAPTTPEGIAQRVVKSVTEQLREQMKEMQDRQSELERAVLRRPDPNVHPVSKAVGLEGPSYNQTIDMIQKACTKEQISDEEARQALDILQQTHDPVRALGAVPEVLATWKKAQD